MQDELRSTNPGEAMSSPVVREATRSPLTRTMMKKIEASRIAVNIEVSNRGPRIEEGRSFRTPEMINVCKGGWSFHTSLYSL